MKDRARPKATPLHATLHPTGEWQEPCVVLCDCGWKATAPDCTTAQRVALVHDKTHQPKEK